MAFKGIFIYTVDWKIPSDGVVIIDDNGEIRQVMTSSMDAKELSKNIVETIAVMKKHKVCRKRWTEWKNYKEGYCLSIVNNTQIAEL